MIHKPPFSAQAPSSGPAPVASFAAMDADEGTRDWDGSEGDGMEEDEATLPPASAGVRSKLNGGHQTEVLYAEEGQFNPKAARAEKKRAKKLKSIPLPDDDDDSDFDFNEARARSCLLAGCCTYV